MDRVTISVDTALLAEIDALVAARGYQNRSEAVRDIARAGLQQIRESETDVEVCVAALVYVYDHHARRLAKRLTRSFHDHHDMSLVALHVHLDQDTCLEVNVLKGRSGEIRHLSEHIIAERGVRHGRLVQVPVDDRPPQSEASLFDPT